MLNLGSGHNKELLEKCTALKEYCLFVERIRKYSKKQPIEESVERAVSECIRENILKEFLLKQRAEVIAMSIFEYNEEEELKKLRAGERELGKEEGKIEGKAEAVCELLEELGSVPDDLRGRIERERDSGLLRRWLKEAARASSVEEFSKSVRKRDKERFMNRKK
ncbi:MAG: hypothetical protein J6C33_04170, partial [Lachnospiraceae bacterium]|nr:hypothetical protein [Lachnospiraceae bacterium]